ncbi:MAG: GNAT family N-acetyltransferase [Butyrivibrio sp.]|nr:GNAT family N-acetyltransferase [Butyrivibrio sp.]
MKTAIVSGQTTRIFKDVLLPTVYTAASHGIPITVIGLFEDRRAVGALAGFIEEGNSFTIASLYVEPKYRRKGGGKLLVESLIRILERQSVPLAFLSFVEGDWDWESFIPFMEALGFTESHEFERLFSTKLSDLYKLFDDPTEDIHIAKLTGLSQKALNSFFDHTSHLSIAMKGSDLASFKMNQNLSFSAITDKEIMGYLLCGQVEGKKDALFIIFSYKAENDILEDILKKFIAICRENYPAGDISVYIPTPDMRLDKVIEHLPTVRNIQHNYVI